MAVNGAITAAIWLPTAVCAGAGAIVGGIIGSVQGKEGAKSGALGGAMGIGAIPFVVTAIPASLTVLPRFVIAVPSFIGAGILKAGLGDKVNFETLTNGIMASIADFYLYSKK